MRTLALQRETRGIQKTQGKPLVRPELDAATSWGTAFLQGERGGFGEE